MTVIAYLTFYLICALNVIWGIRKKRSNALYAVAFIVIFILMTFNYDGPDIEIYRITYELVGEQGNLISAFNATYMEKGYAFIMFYANRLGLDFYAFRIILTFVCLSLLASSIKYYKVNPNFIIGLYMVYLFFFDTIQLRNCVMQFIILFATRYLFSKSGISILKYILCIVVAGSIHTLSWIFLIFLLVRFIRDQKGYQRIFMVASFMFVLCVILQPVLPQIINIIAKLLKRGSGYFNSNTLRFNAWIIMVLHILGLAPLYWYKHKVENEETKCKISNILKLEIIIGLFLPLSFLNSNFNRIFRNILILDTIGLTLLYENLKKNTESNDVTLVTQLILVVGWLATDLYRNREVNIINYPMEYNLVFGHINATDIGQYFIVIMICLIIFYVLKKVSSYCRENKKKVIKCA